MPSEELGAAQGDGSKQALNGEYVLVCVPLCVCLCVCAFVYVPLCVCDEKDSDKCPQVISFVTSKGLNIRQARASTFTSAQDCILSTTLSSQRRLWRKSSVSRGKRHTWQTSGQKPTPNPDAPPIQCAQRTKEHDGSHASCKVGRGRKASFRPRGEFPAQGYLGWPRPKARELEGVRPQRMREMASFHSQPSGGCIIRQSSSRLAQI